MIMTETKKRNIKKLYTTNSDDPEDPEGVRNYFLKIIEVMPNIVYWMDKNGIALGCNKNELDLLGLISLEQFIGLSYDEIGALTNWTKEQIDGFKKADLEVINSGKQKLNIIEPPLAYGENKVVNLITSRVPIFDDKNNCIGVVGISSDITDQLKAKEVSNQLVVEKERSRVLEILGASMAHELRTPLAALRIANDSISQELPHLMEFAIKHAHEYKKMFPDKATEMGKLKKMHLLNEVMQKSIDSANFIINTLLMNINEYNSPVENVVRLSVGDVVSKAIGEYPLTEKEKTLIEWNNNSNFTCNGKETLLVHVIFNLIKNSMYYIKEAGKGSINIYTDTISDKNYNLLIFTDTAKGIAADKLPFIFERFYSNRVGGTGLGLAFCKLAIESFGGEITCDSQEGEYTSFTMAFPKIT